jgi:hypothetical protein
VSDELVIRCERAGAPRAHLADFLPPIDGLRTEIVFALRDATLRRAASITRPAPGGGIERELWHYRRTAAGWRALDRTLFRLDGERFEEAERYEAQDGRNLHARPLRLPATVEMGRSYAPLGDGPARVTPRFSGAVILALGAIEQRGLALALEGDDGRERRIQWLFAGWGEIALGPADGAFDRWAEGGRRGALTLLRGLDEDSLGLPVEPLPAGTVAEPRERLF